MKPKKKNGQALLKLIDFNNNASPTAPIIRPPQLIAASTSGGIISNTFTQTSAQKYTAMNVGITNNTK